MSQETEQEPALDLDREQYVPDWIVEEAVSLALQTQLREPILAAVDRAAVDGSRSDAEPVEVEAVDDDSDEADDGGRGRLRGVIGLVALAVGLLVAYKVVSKKRQ